MANLKSFDIKKLRPFRKPDNRQPNDTPDEDEAIAQLDHDLRPDEQAYVRHYLGYADVLLNDAAERMTTPSGQSNSNVVEMPKQAEENRSDDDDNGSKAA